MGFFEGLIGVSVIFLSLILIGLVLLQKNRGSGLSGAFGGVGGNSAFGTKTGDFLTWVTVAVTALFVILMVAGNWVFIPDYETAVAAPPAQTPQPQPVTPAGGTPSNAPAPATPRPIPLTPSPSPALPQPAPSNDSKAVPAGGNEAAPKSESPDGGAADAAKTAEEPQPASPSELP